MHHIATEPHPNQFQNHDPRSTDDKCFQSVSNSNTASRYEGDDESKNTLQQSTPFHGALDTLRAALETLQASSMLLSPNQVKLELPTAENQNQQQLGRGTFSSVVLAEIISDNASSTTKCAAKILDTNPASFPTRESHSEKFVLNVITNEIMNHLRIQQSSSSSSITKILGIAVIPSNSADTSSSSSSSPSSYPKIVVLMELASGTLHDVVWKQLSVEGRRFSIPTILRYAIQVCSGIAACHEQRLLHCDVKSNNLLYFAEDDCIKLADFGTSRAREAATKSTDDNDDVNNMKQEEVMELPLFFSYPYSPPENFTCDGYGNSFTPQFDVFSFGVVFYQLLTLEFEFWDNEDMGQRIMQAEDRLQRGKPVKQAVPFSMLHLPSIHQVKKAQKKSSSSSTDSDEVTNSLLLLQNRKQEVRPLVELCEKCLAVNPADRPRDCVEVLDVLKKILGALATDVSGKC